MDSQMPTTNAARGEPAGGASTTGARSWWTERTAAVTLAACVLLLDTIPLSAWLLVLAAIFAGDPGQAALPLWYLVALEGVALLAGYMLRRVGPALLLIGTTPGLALGVAGAFWLSPAGASMVSRESRSPASTLFGWIALLTICSYLWWRGLRWSRTTITIDDLQPLFGYAIAVTIVALLASAGVHGQGRGGLDVALFALLPVQIFAGLVALALARAAEAGAMRRRAWANRTGEGPWLRLALALAAIVVGLTLALGLLFARQDMLAALAQVGWLIATVVEWVAFATVYVLYLVLNGPLSAILGLFKFSPLPLPTAPQGAPALCSSGRCPRQHPLPLWVNTASDVIALVVVLLLVAGLIYLAYRVLLAQKTLGDRQQDDVEARESLGGSTLLRAQLRSALDAIRRALPEGGADLTPGSVRRVYRDVLRAASGAGLAREPSETPDEYAVRLDRWAGPTGGDDVTVLTGAYDRARYGESEPGASEQTDVRARGRRIRARLRSHGRQSGS